MRVSVWSTGSEFKVFSTRSQSSSNAEFLLPSHVSLEKSASTVCFVVSGRLGVGVLVEILLIEDDESMELVKEFCLDLCNNEVNADISPTDFLARKALPLFTGESFRVLIAGFNLAESGAGEEPTSDNIKE
ncbi:unnamed protein product [[Candida] boidinii]|nr:unnamed protein product [[Candida] boidinii]